MIRLTWREYLILRHISHGFDRVRISAVTEFSDDVAKRVAKDLLDKFAVPANIRQSPSAYALAVRHGFEHGYLANGDHPQYPPWPGMKSRAHGPECYRARHCRCDGRP